MKEATRILFWHHIVASFVLLPLAHALSFDFHRRHPDGLSRRALVLTGTSPSTRYDFGGASAAGIEAVPGGEKVGNIKDVRYTTNITLNGKDFVVALDTGSTDLWVQPVLSSFGSFNDSTIPLELRYGDGSYGVKGTIGLSPFEMGNYKIPAQAFLHVDSGAVKGVTDLGIDGLLGLSFDLGAASPINLAIKQRYGQDATWGRSVLKNIFSRDPTEPNFIAIDLARTDDLEDTAGGSFFIGEYAKQWEAVATAPKLAQVPKGGNRWTTLLEGVSVDGVDLQLQSKVPDVPSGRLLTLLDTGDPTAIVPTKLMFDIYSKIPGAVTFKQGSSQIWLLPCNTTTSVAFTFSGQKFPIHPLDLSAITKPIPIDGKQYTACVASMQGEDNWAGYDYEVSLGDVFLRNVYSVFDFGDNEPNGTLGEPYMQLLSQTVPAKAASQVSTIRGKAMASLDPELPPAQLLELLKNSDPTIDIAGSAESPSPSSPSRPTKTSTSSGSNVETIESAADKYGPVIIALLAGNLIVGLILITLAVLNHLRRSGPVEKSTTTGPSYMPLKVRDEEGRAGTNFRYPQPYQAPS